MWRAISEVTGIVCDVLADPSNVWECCVATIMSWVAGRKTTRSEDRSYSLMGLFGINMPALYGEGRQNAFRWLQIEIMNMSFGMSIFA
jgi:hypothetical protein